MTSPNPEPSQPEPTADPNRPTDSDQAALFDAVAAEHAAIYGYGIVSAHIYPDENELVSRVLAEHRDRREAAVAGDVGQDGCLVFALADDAGEDGFLGIADGIGIRKIKRQLRMVRARSGTRCGKLDGPATRHRDQVPAAPGQQPRKRGAKATR